MNHLIDFGVYALAGRRKFIIIHICITTIITFKRYFKCICGCSNLMLNRKSPIIRRKAKRKVQYCQTVKLTKRA